MMTIALYGKDRHIPSSPLFIYLVLGFRGDTSQSNLIVNCFKYVVVWVIANKPTLARGNSLLYFYEVFLEGSILSQRRTI